MNTSTVLAAEHEITAAERDLAQVYLQQTHTGITGAIKGLSPAQWSFAPAPDRWSIAEIVEHVVFVFDLVLGPLRQQLAEAPAPPADRDCQLIDSIVIAQFPNRITKFPAPPMSHPGGRFVSPAEAAGPMKKIYADLNEYLESPDLRLHAIPAAPLKALTRGAHETMDGYQWILAAAAHCERHTKQILEVRADPHFPAA
jgi:hypothetical protein